MFGWSSLLPLVGEGASLVSESVDKADPLSQYVDSKQSQYGHSIAIRLIVLSPLPSGQVRLGESC